MADQAHPGRRSGAPGWAVLLGLGTAEESKARTPAVKWIVRVFWTMVLTVAFAGYFAVTEGPSEVSFNVIVVWALLAVLVVMSWTLGTSLYLRQRSQQSD